MGDFSRNFIGTTVDSYYWSDRRVIIDLSNGLSVEIDNTYFQRNCKGVLPDSTLGIEGM